MIRVACLLALFSPVLLTGCAASFNAAPTAGQTAAVSVSGTLKGGNQLVTGSKIYLYSAGTGGYGTAAVSKLTAPGGYVTTGSVGEFSITGLYPCTAGDQYYLLALGGNPGMATGTDNAALAEMAALGDCSLLQPSTHITLNEVTTVAAAYALAGYMTGPTALASSGTSQALTGVKNAFLTAGNLVDNEGHARTTTLGGNGTVPTALINSLANSIANCVNSDGTGPACTTLFAATTPSGGTAPTNTLQALLNVAHNPGQNVSSIYAVSTANAPFQPTLSSAPHDWAMSVQYVVPGDAFSGMEVDASGNIWMNSGSTVWVTSPVGAVTSTYAPTVTGNSIYLSGLAVDAAGKAWFGYSQMAINSGTAVSRLRQINNAGQVTLTLSGGGVTAGINDVTIDSLGNVWTVGGTNSTPTVTKTSSTGTAISPSSGYLPTGQSFFYGGIYANAAGDVFAGPYRFNGTSQVGTTDCVEYQYTGADVSIDANGNAWEYNMVGSSGLQSCSPSGTLSGQYLSGVYSNESTLVDGDNHVLFSSQDGSAVGITTTSGVLLSPADGYQGDRTNTPESDKFTIDQAGNIWMEQDSFQQSQYTVLEYIGLAAPTTMPLSYAKANGKLGQRP